MNSKIGTYEWMFGNLTPEEKQQLADDNIPVPIPCGEFELTKADEKRNKDFIDSIIRKKSGGEK